MANEVDYFEVASPDPEGSKAFYGQLFDWSMTNPSPVGYHMVNIDKGGLWDTSSVGGGNWSIFYVHVQDVKQAITKAEDLGGKVLLPFTDNGVIEFAHIEDPQGNRFGVWRPKSAK